MRIKLVVLLAIFFVNLNDLSPRWNAPVRYQMEQTSCNSFGFLKTVNREPALYDNQTGAKRWTQKDSTLLGMTMRCWREVGRFGRKISVYLR